MEFNMDIDTGGTFTDGFVRGGGRFELVKVDTTPHDFTLCFMNCIEEAAKKFDFQSADQLLSRMNTLRLSTTIGTNTLIQASGPKLGLLVTRGAGENAYAPEQENPAVGFIIPPGMIIGIDEEIDENGLSIRSPQAGQVLAAVKDLLERGARRIVVSLARSPLNPAHEIQCRDIILADYPAHYLGSVPLLLSTEVSNEMDDRYRTNAALIDAYIHQEMARYLYKADDDVRNRQYRWPLLITHATGGAARVAKTKAIDTCDSGPAAGLLGAAFISRMYGLKNVITLDVGGTSSDIGLIDSGEPGYTAEKSISDIPVRERFIESISIGGGGGSIARLDYDAGKLKVGPESAGSIPGPACYGLGGAEPAVTDAWVALGYIDPDYFLGGRRKLDVSQARAAIKDNIAEPLGVPVEKAAEAVVQTISAQVAWKIKDFLRTKGMAKDNVTLFAFGGAGGLLCGSVARMAGIRRSYFFPFGAAFCAFGSSCTDVLHNYRLVKNLPLDEASVPKLNTAVRSMIDDAYFDMKGEGFEKDRVSLVLEIAVSAGQKSSRPPEEAGNGSVLRFQIVDQGDISLPVLRDLYVKEAGAASAEDVFIRELRLKAFCRLPDPQFPVHTPEDKSPHHALKGSRTTFHEGNAVEAQVYDQKLLGCGDVVRGMAFIESADTTILVPPGYRYTVDRYLNGVMEEEAG